jgi:hypothetical protein
MRRTYLFLAIFLSIGRIVHAAEPTSSSSMEELLQQVEGNDTVSGLKAMVEGYAQARVKQIVAAARLSSTESARLESALADTSRSLTESVTWARVKPMVVARYEKALSSQEMDQLVAMMKTPAWRIYVEKVMPLSVELKLAVNSLAPSFYRELENELQRRLAETTKRSDKPA